MPRSKLSSRPIASKSSYFSTSEASGVEEAVDSVVVPLLVLVVALCVLACVCVCVCVWLKVSGNHFLSPIAVDPLSSLLLWDFMPDTLRHDNSSEHWGSPPGVCYQVMLDRPCATTGMAPCMCTLRPLARHTAHSCAGTSWRSELVQPCCCAPSREY